VHVVGQGHELVLDLLELLFDVGVRGVQWSGFVEATEGVLSIGFLVLIVGWINLTIIFVISNFGNRLKQNSQEEIQKHEVTQEHHENEKNSWSEALVSVNNQNHDLIPILTCQDDEHSNQSNTGVGESVSGWVVSVHEWLWEELLAQ
jgi:hypothetical protein